MTQVEYNAYLEGWGARMALESSDANPHDQANGASVLRVRWFEGWYDRHFWDKYRDKLWRKRDRK